MSQFSSKMDKFDFLAQICPKMDFWFEIKKTNVEIRISMLEIPCMPTFRQTNIFDFFCPNLPKKEFKVGNS